MKKYIGYIIKLRDLLYILAIALCCVYISGQISKVKGLNSEIIRQENNKKALTDTLTIYKDELGRINAEKHAYQLTQKELRDSIGLLKKKNTEYVSYINSIMNITDTVTIESVIIREVASSSTDNGSISVSKSDEFGKSTRMFSVDIPYSVTDNRLTTGNALFTLNQNIFVEGWLERNTKTKETYMHLRSDYPGLVFNSGMGIVAETGKSYERSMRRTNGIGLAVGPGVGLNYDFTNKRMIPTVGVNVVVGFTYTPKIFQW